MIRTIATAAAAAALLAGCSAPVAAAPVPTVTRTVTAAPAPVCDPDSCDPDEGETVPPEELITSGTAVTISGNVYVPCVTEDYEGPARCYWDAGARSNGKGRSFLWSGTALTYLP